MREKLSYRGYQTRIEFSAEDGCFVGHLEGIADIVGFHGDTAEEAARDFHEAVDFYLESCARHGEAPCRPQAPRAAFQPPSRPKGSFSLALAGQTC